MSCIPTAGWENELKVSEDQCGSISNQNARRILAFLKEGEKRLNFSTPLINAIFLVGNTGSGKTTLSQFLATEDLISYEVYEESGEFLIRHKDDDINADSTVVSKTTYPRLFSDPKTRDIYIDLGGFNDTGRNEVYDMASAYFIQKVMGMAENVKILLIADHSSLRKGVNRYDFVLLLQHVCVLLKNIEKYLDGVALIATKVDNNFVSDSATIKNIANFLTEVKDSLKNMQNSEGIYNTKFSRKENQSFIRKSKLLLDTLLQKSDTGEYSRLGIFRRPNTPGSVSEIQFLQNNKADLKLMLKNNLNYVSNAVDDIGYPISFKTKNVLRDLADEIHKNVEEKLNSCINGLIAYYDRAISDLFNDKEALKDHLAESSEGLIRIRNSSECSSLKDFISNAQAYLTDSCKQCIFSFLVDIANLDKFLQFIGKLASKCFDFCIKKWLRSLEAVIAFVENALASASEAVKQSAFSFYQWIKTIVGSFKQKVQDIFKDMIEYLCTLL